MGNDFAATADWLIRALQKDKDSDTAHHALLAIADALEFNEPLSEATRSYLVNAFREMGEIGPQIPREADFNKERIKSLADALFLSAKGRPKEQWRHLFVAYEYMYRKELGEKEIVAVRQVGERWHLKDRAVQQAATLTGERYGQLDYLVDILKELYGLPGQRRYERTVAEVRKRAASRKKR